MRQRNDSQTTIDERTGRTEDMDSHPVATGVGAVVGALAGRAAAQAVDPATEGAYWRDNFTTRPFVNTGSTYDDYGPAYRYGVDPYSKYPDRRFDEVESDLGRDWPTKHDAFLAIVPWADPCSVIEPNFLKEGRVRKNGHPPRVFLPTGC